MHARIPIGMHARTCTDMFVCRLCILTCTDKSMPTHACFAGCYHRDSGVVHVADSNRVYIATTM